MANSHKTKAEILQELESIKGLLLEEDDIPVLQEIQDVQNIQHFYAADPIIKESSLENSTINTITPPAANNEQTTPDHKFREQQVSLFEEQQKPFEKQQKSFEDQQTSLFHEQQTSLFDDENDDELIDNLLNNGNSQTSAETTTSHESQNSFAAKNPSSQDGKTPTVAARPLAKATGENPFLPQHIRERLHGNNPPPLFEYETAKKILNATKNIQNKINKPRQHLIEDVLKTMLPQIESELRHRLFAMTLEELENLLKNQD